MKKRKSKYYDKRNSSGDDFLPPVSISTPRDPLSPSLSVAACFAVAAVAEIVMKCGKLGIANDGRVWYYYYGLINKRGEKK